MSKQREALELALDAFDNVNPRPIGFWNGKETAYFEHELVDGCLPIGDCTIPLYAYPPTRKPLTDEQLRALARDAGIKLMNDEALALGYLPAAIKKFAKAIERAHGIGEA